MSFPPDETRSHTDAPRPELGRAHLPETVHHAGRDTTPSERVQPPGYEILGELGRGGMGVVYKARQVELDRIVALKMIVAGDHASEKELHRFRTEAQAVAQIQHPNIVQIFDVGVHDGRPFFTLEHLGGGSLADRLKDKPLPPKEAALVVQRVAEGMAYAHSRGFVHRDLKPANVLFDADSSDAARPKIADFGLAKRYDVEETGLTRTGAVLGTPAYMSPEQASGKSREIGPPTDVYAMGVILYQCVTGIVPFRGANIQEIFQQIWTQEPVSPKSLLPSVPLDLCTICLKCLEKEPVKRYRSSAALAEDLRRFLADESILARPASKVERLRKWAKRNRLMTELSILLVIALIVGTAISIGYAIQAQESLEVARKNEKKAEDETTRVREEQERTKAALTRVEEERERTARALDEVRQNFVEGQLLLAQAAWKEQSHVRLALECLDRIPESNREWEWHYLRRKFEGGIFTLSGHVGAVNSVAVSASGDRIASYSDDGKIRVWDGRTGEPIRTLRRPGQVLNMVMSDDGKWLLSGRLGGEVLLWNLDAGTAKILVADGIAMTTRVAMTPDGSRLAAVVGLLGVFVWDGKTGQTLHFLRNPRLQNEPVVAIAPDGDRVAVSLADDRLIVWDLKRGTTAELATDRLGRVKGLAFTPDGRQVVSRFTHGGIGVWPATGGPRTREFGPIGVNPWPSLALSPDGAWVAAGEGDGSIRLWNKDRGELVRRFRGHAEAVSSLAFSANGTTLLSGSSDGTLRLWDARSEDPVPAIRLGDRDPSLAAVSDDGGTIAVPADGNAVSVWDGRTGLKRFDLLGHVKPVTTVAVSGDGARLASGSADRTVRVWDGNLGTSLLQLEGHPARVTCLAISRDGASVLSGSNDRAVRLWDGATGALVAERRLPQAGPDRLWWSGDGERFGVQSRGSFLVWDRVGEDIRLRQPLSDQRVVMSPQDDFRRVVYAEDRSLFGTTDNPSRLRIWEQATGQSSPLFFVHRSLTSSLAVSRDGRRMIESSHTAFGSGETYVWDVERKLPLVQLASGGTKVEHVVASQDGTRYFGSCSDGYLRCWDALPLPEPGAPISDAERTRRLWLTRPDPVWHTERRKAFEAEGNRRAAQLHRSLEQQALGVVALDENRWGEAYLHFVAARLLKPKPPELPEVLSRPKELP